MRADVTTMPGATKKPVHVTPSAPATRTRTLRTDASARAGSSIRTTSNVLGHRSRAEVTRVWPPSGRWVPASGSSQSASTSSHLTALSRSTWESSARRLSRPPLAGKPNSTPSRLSSSRRVSGPTSPIHQTMSYSAPWRRTY
ncbi:hypothetical protein SGLAM104S_07117 [Streptomyces glaucescens]